MIPEYGFYLIWHYGGRFSLKKKALFIFKMIKIKLVKANIRHSKKVFLWRNEPNTIPWMASKKAINFEDHNNWYKKAIKDKNCMLFIICYEGEEVGQLRYNIDKTLGEKVARVSMNITEKMQGKGIGSVAFKLGLQNVKACKFADKVQVRVHEIKEGWIRSMEKIGFKKSGFSTIHGERQLVLIG